MKTKLFLLVAIVAIALASCNKSEPELFERGRIIGTLGFYDESQTNFYKGYFIETDKKDIYLSFNIDVQDSIVVHYGTWSISPITIPYPFKVVVLNANDPLYVHFVVGPEDAMHPSGGIPPLDEVDQVWIIPQE